MLKFEKKSESGISQQAETTLTLGKDQREKSRLKVILDDGREAGLFFEKGTSFQHGDLIVSADGKIIVEIKAAPEKVSIVRCDDPHKLAKACYHLGNRHIALQIDEAELRYQHDHVLDEMVRGLGLEVTVEQAPFEPEPGAYQGGGHHHHSHDDEHRNSDIHKHDHHH